MVDLNIVKEYEKLHDNIVKYGSVYIKKHPKIKTLVIGMSGGIDSTITACLAKDIANNIKVQENRDIKIIGRSLPINSKAEERALAFGLGGVLCDDFKEVDLITPYVNTAVCVLGDAFINGTHSLKDKIRLGNVKARTRMLFLYDLAQATEGLVLSTDNFTEYLLGFWTLHGDVGDFGLIQNLWKTEVYKLADYLLKVTEDSSRRTVLELAINAKPTDGLGITNSDFDQIVPEFVETVEYRAQNWRALYEVIDNALLSYMITGEVTIESVIDRYIGTEYKRNNPISLKRTSLTRW